jgi:hypothetical protein
MFKKNVPEDQSFELSEPARNWRPSFDCPPSRGEEQTHSCLVAHTAVEAAAKTILNVVVDFNRLFYLVKASFFAEKQQVDAQKDKQDGCYGREAAHKDRRGWIGGRLG